MRFRLVLPAVVVLATTVLMARPIVAIELCFEGAWDARGSASGVYFARLIVCAVSQTKQIIVMKYECPGGTT